MYSAMIHDTSSLSAVGEYPTTSLRPAAIEMTPIPVWNGLYINMQQWVSLQDYGDLRKSHSLFLQYKDFQSVNMYSPSAPVETDDCLIYPWKKNN